MDPWMLLLVLVAAVVALLTWRASRPRPLPPPLKYHLGDVTLESLRYYCGYDYMRPVLVAIKGKVYDVTNSFDQFGPGKPLHAYAGREATRALARGSVDEKDLAVGASLEGLGPEELALLADKEAEFALKYDVVGQVVPLREMSLAELALHDGSDPSKALMLAIQGTVYDITKGKNFYGPDGVYPFAGKEVARAFALLSTELADCNADLQDLSYTELENLKEWTAKFNFKYPIVGKIVGGQLEPVGAAVKEQQ